MLADARLGGWGVGGRGRCHRPWGARNFPERQIWRAVSRLQRKALGDRMPPNGVSSAVVPEELLYIEAGWTKPYRWAPMEEVAESPA